MRIKVCGMTQVEQIKHLDTIGVEFAGFIFYHKSNLAKKIVQEKPMFFSNHKLTIYIVLLSSLIVISWMFWGAFYSRSVLSNCS